MRSLSRDSEAHSRDARIPLLDDPVNLGSEPMNSMILMCSFMPDETIVKCRWRMKRNQGQGGGPRKSLAETGRQKHEIVCVHQQLRSGVEVRGTHCNPLGAITQGCKDVITLKPVAYGIEQDNLRIRCSLNWIEAPVFAKALQDWVSPAAKTGIPFMKELAEMEVFRQRAYGVECEIESACLQIEQCLRVPGCDFQCDPWRLLREQLNQRRQNNEAP